MSEHAFSSVHTATWTPSSPRAVEPACSAATRTSPRRSVFLLPTRVVCVVLSPLKSAPSLEAFSSAIATYGSAMTTLRLRWIARHMSTSATSVLPAEVGAE